MSKNLVRFFELDERKELSYSQKKINKSTNLPEIINKKRMIKVFSSLDDLREDFITEFSERYRTCIISNKKLKQSIENLNMTLQDILLNYIPDNPSIMSGDFGEILSFCLIDDYSNFNLNKKLDGVMKWRHKIDKNKSLNYTDIIFFHRIDQKKPNPKDLVSFSEVKTNSNNKKRKTIQESVDDSKIDYVSRAASTLSWLRELSIRKNNIIIKKYLDRFINSVEDKNGPYIKEFKAISVIDKNFLENEFKNEIMLEDETSSCDIIIISVGSLRELYNIHYDKLKSLSSYA